MAIRQRASSPFPYLHCISEARPLVILTNHHAFKEIDFNVRNLDDNWIKAAGQERSHSKKCKLFPLRVNEAIASVHKAGLSSADVKTFFEPFNVRFRQKFLPAMSVSASYVDVDRGQTERFLLRCNIAE